MRERYRLWGCLLSVTFVVILFLSTGANGQGQDPATGEEPWLMVLGVAQDGGYPQAGCRKACCARAWTDPAARRHIVSLALVDPRSDQRWLFECTPDFREQLHALDEIRQATTAPGLDGIFLTHAHIGHYGGLLQLGREVLGAKAVPVHVMPRFSDFLRTQGPWSQLVKLQNIEVRPLAAEAPVRINDRLTVTALTVPHRDEFSETVAFRIEGPRKKILFLPDIDKWERWERAIEQELAIVDIAYLDATFFDGAELPGRDMREIPHPFVVESLQRFGKLNPRERAKIRLIHLNHTNPLLNPESDAVRQVKDAGLGLAVQGERVEM
ncbi:MAG: MBL fold metallo-hydrolase [Planctomycetota bacterium]